MSARDRRLKAKAKRKRAVKDHRRHAGSLVLLQRQMNRLSQRMEEARESMVYEALTGRPSIPNEDLIKWILVP